jgi:uncharacterized protein (DUF1330 family)
MHIEPSQEALAAFFSSPPLGPVVMLNLLRFRDEADYTRSPQLAPSSPVSGEEAYRLYAGATMPFLAKAGADVIYQGKSNAFLIGPSDENWDLVLLVRYPDVQAFMGMVTNPDYLAGAGHRTAALLDSRLLPMIDAA